MKFKSRKDVLVAGIVYGVNVGIAGLIFLQLWASEAELGAILLTAALFATVAGFLFWIHHGTSYHLTPNYLHYKSGPVQGHIEVARIREVVIGKTVWVGFRPATARKGLIIKYDKYNELYISPETNELFIQHLLRLNKDIKITAS